MAVSAEALCDEEFFTSLGMLIIQGRKWDAFRRIRGRGLHCPTVRNLSPPHHQCSISNLECQRALAFQRTIEGIWHAGGVVAIEVILLPECGHAEPALLLERWTLKITDAPSKMSQLSLLQAIDSTIHFSQLSSWWASTNGSRPESVLYNVYEHDGDSVDRTEFRDTPIEHQFATCDRVNVRLKSLPRRPTLPIMHCELCESVSSTKDGSRCQERGRSFLQARPGSRHSSGSSNSVSTAANFEPGSPASRSRSRSPRSSGVLDNLHSDCIDQDVELANQLDSLSDSDLSDDYVIDGPVGSPGLVGAPVASPHDTRVQILQSAYAGFHIRHPAFDRLMGDVTVGDSENRTRHSSLDSAVSNLEKLDLEARRKLSRTSSDGQNFVKLKEQCKKSVEAEFFIRDRKKRHKPLPDYSCSTGDLPQCSANSQSLYAPYQNAPAISSHCLEVPPLTDEFRPSHCGSNTFDCLGHKFRPSHDLTVSAVGYLSVEYPGVTRRSFLPPCEPMVVSDDCLGLNLMMHPTSSHGSFPKQKQADEGQEQGNVEPCHALAIDECSFSMSLFQKRDPNDQEGHGRQTLPRQCKRDCSPSATSREMDIRQRRKVSDEDLKLDLEDLNTEQETSGDSGNAVSSLLRSPPSKLRVLPSNCVENNYAHNPKHEAVHKPSQATPCGTARKLRFNPPQQKTVCTSPPPLRRNNSVRFEFDEDMSKLNQRSSRSVCRGKCMKRNGLIVHGHNHLTPTRRLLGSFEESIIHDRLEILGSVDGFQAELGASGSFCPLKVKLPIPVQFFHVSDDNAPSPYMGTMSLKGKECKKRRYPIPRKGTIQLTLFNPNNKVVKVFVILYDVEDMPAGHCTFLRHRIFSRPVEGACDARGTGSGRLPEDSNGSGHRNQPSPKQLRYFVHLRLESSKTNNVYIHGNIKILFSLASNEWDSGNTFELHSETEFPSNPKYSSKRSHKCRQ